MELVPKLKQNLFLWLLTVQKLPILIFLRGWRRISPWWLLPPLLLRRLLMAFSSTFQQLMLFSSIGRTSWVLFFLCVSALLAGSIFILYRGVIVYALANKKSLWLSLETVLIMGAIPPLFLFFGKWIGVLFLVRSLGGWLIIFFLPPGILAFVAFLRWWFSWEFFSPPGSSFFSKIF